MACLKSKKKKKRYDENFDYAIIFENCQGNYA